MRRKGNNESKGQTEKKAYKKCRRIGRLKRTKADTGMLWATGVAPSISYGAEVFGMNGHELQITRRKAGAVGLPGGGGRSLPWGFLRHGRKNIDPIWTAGIVAAVSWSREAWFRRGSLAPMRLAWQYAHSTTAKAKRIWWTVIGLAIATWAT